MLGEFFQVCLQRIFSELFKPSLKRQTDAKWEFEDFVLAAESL